MFNLILRPSSHNRKKARFLTFNMCRSRLKNDVFSQYKIRDGQKFQFPIHSGNKVAVVLNFSANFLNCQDNYTPENNKLCFYETQFSRSNFKKITRFFSLHRNADTPEMR